MIIVILNLHVIFVFLETIKNKLCDLRLEKKSRCEFLFLYESFHVLQEKHEKIASIYMEEKENAYVSSPIVSVCYFLC